MILIIVLLTLLTFVFPVHAQDFIPYQNNPVLYVNGGMYQPSVLKDKSTYDIWFTEGQNGRAVISNMKSSNGIDWYDKKTLNLSSSKNNHDPSMIFQNGTYDLYFASSNLNYSDMSLWKASSSDGTTITLGSEKRIMSPSLPWEGNSISSPSIIQDNGITYLFYSGNGNNWAIGLATSPDGETWNKCATSPIVPNSSGPYIVQYDSQFFLFFHTTSGTVEMKKAVSLDGCNTIWSNSEPLPFSLNDPTALVVDSNLWIYGTAQSTHGSSLFLAGSSSISPPSYPIVLVPGMFASWNKEAMLHNTTVDNSLWKINKNVSEYDAFLSTLENVGRIQGKDVFIFPYDWRKSITDTTKNLDSFLNSTVWNLHPYQPVQLVGHSLGGVVTRVYADQNDSKPIKNAVSVGAPLLGAVQAYKPLFSGDIDRENTLIWMAEKLILLLNKTSSNTNKEKITQMLPILYDVLPAFPYLKNENNIEVMSSLTNPLLFSYPIKTAPNVPQLYLGGSGIQTLAGHTVDSKNNIISSWKEEGDGVVLSKSTLNTVTPAPLQNHGETIYARESIKTILSNLGVAVQDSNIPTGKATSIFPAILVFIQSPATMQITHDGLVTKEDEGMIHIQNANNGVYSLQVSGNKTGEYTLGVWLIGSSEDKWFQFKKQATSGKTDEYVISFDGNLGGMAKEYVAPSPTPTPSPKPTAKPTCIPKPTNKPQPTAKPSPTPKPQNHGKEIKIIKLWIKLVSQFFQFLIRKDYKLKSAESELFLSSSPDMEEKSVESIAFC